jgi:hypothetical protein
MLKEKESERVDKLRKLCDRVARTVMDRQNSLKDLKNKVMIFSLDYNMEKGFIILSISPK